MQFKQLIGITIGLSVCAGSTAALAQDPPRPSALSITPHVGVVSESAFVDGLVRFANGDTDYISVEPRTGVLLGVELNYRFRPKVSGVLALSYTTASARYIEKDNLRRDAGVSTIRLQPGVMVDVVERSKLAVAVGGGLTIARIAFDDINWDGRPVDPGSTAIGLFGAIGLDVALSRRASFHAHLALELNKPSYGDLETGLARAEGELGADVDHDLRTAGLLVAGVTFAL